MPKMYIYGEDGLTLKYTKEELGEVLKKLEDESDPNECTVFFRPSFGRSQYGEFDAIIISHQKAYLVEAKWDQSGNLSGGLRKDQIRRHNILKWYSQNWKGEKGDDWNLFAKKHNPEFKKIFEFGKKKANGERETKYIPNSASRVGQNLQTILTAIGDREVVNVLLIFYRDNLPRANQDGFTTIYIKYDQTLNLFTELE